MDGAIWGMSNPSTGSFSNIQSSEANRQALSAKSQVVQLERRLDKLTLICMAMWSFLQERTDLTEKDLMDRVQQIDLEDGQLDGKMAQETARCHKCGRVLSRRHQRCIYCGSERPETSSFDGAL